MGNTVINIENAVVSYREDIALRDVSVKVRFGEFVGIVGPNGAGKTTLLTVLTGWASCWTDGCGCWGSISARETDIP